MINKARHLELPADLQAETRVFKAEPLETESEPRGLKQQHDRQTDSDFLGPSPGPVLPRSVTNTVPNPEDPGSWRVYNSSLVP